MARGLCTLTGVVHCKAAFTNSLQYLKFVYHFTTISKHFHMYSIIYLLLTRMNPGEQAVSYYPNWTGVESTTKWLNSMPHTIVAAKSQIQTVTRAYDWVQVVFTTPQSLNEDNKLLFLSSGRGWEGHNVLYTPGCQPGPELYKERQHASRGMLLLPVSILPQLTPATLHLRLMHDSQFFSVSPHHVSWGRQERTWAMF